VDELVRVLALHLRYGGAPQGALVHDLSSLGLAPARIGELLGTSSNTVSQQKREKRPVWPPKKPAAER
jgi:predicted transcriptional regulator